MSACGSLRAMLLSLLVTGPACSDATTELVPDAVPHSVKAGMDAGQDASASPDAGATGAGARDPVRCGGAPCACDNGEDDDGDGDVDGLDPECTGPYDDDEETFATGIPGGNIDQCEDCFWDDNSGSGDDDCRYHSDCLLGEVPTSMGNSECSGCEVSEGCVENCKERTPNGCDCFGCCEVHLKADKTVAVLLRDTCSVKHAEDPEHCPPCVMHPICRNDCGECELCPGRKAKDLPATCKDEDGDDTPENLCNEGEQVCTEATPCPPDLWCQLGCCEFIPL